MDELRLNNLRRPPRSTLRDHISDALLAAIITGELEPGELYSAPALSERFGVSPTPVREAMLDLVKRGLVTTVPNKGFRITQASTEDLDAITAIRLLLEPPSVRAITPIVPDGDLPGLREMAQDIVDAGARGDLVGYVDTDTRFHLALLGYCDNPRLSAIVADLRAQTRLLGLSDLDESQLLESAREHLTIVDLIEARDADAVEAALRRHIGHVRGIWAGNEESA